MPLQIFAINRTLLLEPVPHHGAVYVVVVYPTFVARVIGRVNVNALHAPGVLRQQRFERFQVVAVNDEILFCKRDIFVKPALILGAGLGGSEH